MTRSCGCQQAGDDGEIGQIARTECDGLGRAFERGDIPLHLAMQIDGAGEHAHAAGAGAIFADCLDGGFVDAGVADQTEIVVGREHQ